MPSHDAEHNEPAAHCLIHMLPLLIIARDNGVCVQVIVMIIIFSQYMRHLYIPIRSYKWRIFELFPVLLGIVTVWIYGAP